MQLTKIFASKRGTKPTPKERLLAWHKQHPDYPYRITATYVDTGYGRNECGLQIKYDDHK